MKLLRFIKPCKVAFPMRYVLRLCMLSSLFVSLLLCYIELRYSFEPADSLEPIPEECVCKDSSGKNYNFCYKFGIGSRATHGQRFNCSLVPIAKNLGLLESDKKYLDLTKEDFPAPVFVTGSSSGKFATQKNNFATVHKYFPNQKIVFYDLGLSENHVGLVKSYCNVEYRKFRFDVYPEHVKNLMQYRWKPLIIAETLKEFGAIWWMDASVVWKKDDLSHVYELLRCRKNRHGIVDELQGPPRVQKPNASWIESGWHKALWQNSVWHCDKFSYLLNGFTGHGIYPATHPDVYRYFPSDFVQLKNERAKMYEAGFAFVVNTAEAVQDVLKWYVLCALEKDCMAPTGATLGCHFTRNDRYKEYANCHRYDQSVVNLLLANRNYFDNYYYTSTIVDFFNIVRGGGNFGVPKVCS